MPTPRSPLRSGYFSEWMPSLTGPSLTCKCATDICCVEHAGFAQPQIDDIAPQSNARVICKCRRAATEIPQVLKVPRTCNLHLLLQLKKIPRQMQTASSAWVITSTCEVPRFSAGKNFKGGFRRCWRLVCSCALCHITKGRELDKKMVLCAYLP